MNAAELELVSEARAHLALVAAPEVQKDLERTKKKLDELIARQRFELEDLQVWVAFDTFTRFSAWVKAANSSTADVLVSILKRSRLVRSIDTFQYDTTKVGGVGPSSSTSTTPR